MTALMHHLRARWHLWMMLLLAYVPMLLTRPGQVSADTKSYLYLDPGALLAEASSLWSSSFGAGTVTHQYIGYLWPMGPYFWIADSVGLPDWLAQRLWWASLVFLAMLGANRVVSMLRIPTAPALVAGLVYGLSPYALHYLARLSGILLPWVGLPWLIVCLIMLRRDRSWANVAKAALIVGTIGTVNATALLYVVLGVALWLACDAVAGITRWRTAVADLLKIGATSVMVSAWWIVALVTQSRYGLPMLRYTETYETVAKTSLPQEILRGLGYWFFYGGDESGRWIGPSVAYMNNTVVIAAGFALALIALAAVTLTDGAHRFHVALFSIVGMTLSVGASPLGNQTPFGGFFERLMAHEAAFALRSTPRALPLVLLAFSIAIAMALHRLRHVGPLLSRALPNVAAIGVVILVAINNFPWFTGDVMTPSITRQESLPAYWTQMARVIDEQRDVNGYGRNYEFPASNFADHWWGGTVDPALKGIMRAEYLAKEMVPLGSEPTTDLLSAFESRLVDGRADTTTLTSLAEILSANTVSWRADLAYDHFLTARPEYLAPLLDASPPGVELFRGPPVSTADQAAIVDESWFAHRQVDSYPLLQAWTIPRPRPLISTTAPSALTTVVGSGEGVINALTSRVMSSADTFVYAGTRPFMPTSLTGTTINHLIVTDTNRKAERQWSSVAQQTGRTESVDEPQSTGRPTDQRLNPFTDDHRSPIGIELFSTSRMLGDIASVRASSYGHPVVLTPEHRPEHGVDGDPRTAWVVGVRGRAVGEWISIEYRRPMSTNVIEMDFTVREPGDRRLQEVRFDLHDDGGRIVRSVVAPIEPTGRQRIQIPPTTFRSLNMTVTRESLSDSIDYSFAPGIAISEILIPGTSGTEFIQVPPVTTSLIPMARHTSFVLTRQGIDPSIPHRADQETALNRIIEMPSATTSPNTGYILTGTARLAGRAPESSLSTETSMNIASSDVRLWGAVNSLASLAFDGDPDTAWISPLDGAIGATLNTRRAPTADSRVLRVTVVDDRFHSIPTRILATDGDNDQFVLELDERDSHLMATLPADFTFPLTTITIDDVRERTFANYFSKAPRQLPVAISEIDFGAANTLVEPSLSDRCRDDLIAVNGEGVAVRLRANGALFDSSTTIVIEACEPLALLAGENLITTAKGLDTGIDIDQVVISGRESAPVAIEPSGAELSSRGRTNLTASIETTGPTVVSFAQSINQGWRATLKTNTATIDLGRPFVVQGYANGWLVPQSGELTLTWEPQRVVRYGLMASVSTVAVLMALVLRQRARRARGSRAPREPEATPSMPVVTRWDSTGGRIVVVVAVATSTALVAGVIPALIALASLVLPRRLVVALVALAMTAIAGVVVVGQMRFNYPATLDWALRFSDLSPVAWTAVAMATINPILRRQSVQLHHAQSPGRHPHPPGS